MVRLALAWGYFAAIMSDQVDSQTWTRFIPSGDILSTDDPPSSFARVENTLSPVGVSSSLDDRPALLQTNKFYSNFVIDGPARSAWTLPYIVTINDEAPWGLYVSWPRFFEGASEEDGRLRWYATTANRDLVMSASELEENHEALLTGADDVGLTAEVTWGGEGTSGSMMTYLVRGMAYATVIYDNYTPVLSTVHAIISVNAESPSNGPHSSSDGRFVIGLNNGDTWIVYCSDTSIEFDFVMAEPNESSMLVASTTLTGTLRSTLVPYSASDSRYSNAVALLDEHAGLYPRAARIRAEMRSTTNTRARYFIIFATRGDSSVDLLHYALPHHQDLLLSSQKTGVFLSSPTKGDMELVTGSRWRLREYFLPDFNWAPPASSITDDAERAWIEYYLESEIAATLDNYAGPSVYFGGKNLMAFAQLCLIADELGRDDLVTECIDKVEDTFSEYIAATNGNPLAYDTIWGGIIGTAGLEENSEGADFYASFYNDHHFHYSYLLHAAAVLAHLKPSWATPSNVEWVETLIRDVNSPNTNDPHFPTFRNFDWFCGHSWARGLLFAYDGKDQESTSEDVNFYYAMTMWAIATSNTQLEELGRLQTGMVKRSIQRYFLLKDDNDVHPPDFVRNKVTGIFFESKVDYTTWFGANVEYIHGIQNIPVTAITEYVREPEFVSEEWEQRLASEVGDADGVWPTVLYMSYATIQKHLAFANMLISGVDDGLHRAWALYWAATRPDCDTYCQHDGVSIGSPPSPSPGPGPITSDQDTGPYNGEPAIIPGTIEAEEFDIGGEGVAYSDADPGNNGGELRTTEGVDIKLVGTGGFYVGWTAPGEYMMYSVDVQSSASAYDFAFVVAAPPGLAQPGTFHIVTGGQSCSDYDTDLSGIISVESTGGWGNFETVFTTGGGDGGLSAGETTLRLCVLSSGFNIDSFTMTAA